MLQIRFDGADSGHNNRPLGNANDEKATNVAILDDDEQIPEEQTKPLKPTIQ